MLSLQNISYKFDSEENVNIINDISLDISAGEIVIITGPNGGGKTTLAKLIMGIIKPTTGKIILDGQDITDLSVTDRAKIGIGYAFQTPPRFKGMTVRKLLSIAASEKSNNCGGILKLVGLCGKDYLDRALDSSLSGGELKRIEVATVLSRKLKIAVFDEPEAGIDLWSTNLLVDTFRKAKRDDMALIIISHQEKIIRIADRAVIVTGGVVSEIGTPEKILDNFPGTSCERKCRRI